MKADRERHDLDSHRALRVAQRVADLEDDIANAAALLNCLPFGVMLLDAHGRVLRANRRAQRLLVQDDGLSDSPDGLRALRAEDTIRLRRLVARAAHTANSESVLALPRPSGRRALQVFVTPPGDAPAPPWRVRRSGVVIFVADPDDPVLPTADALRVASMG